MTRLGVRVLIFKESFGMPSLLEALQAREVEVRGRLEELAGQVAFAQTELDRLLITRGTVQALLGPGSGGSRPGGDDRSARMPARRLSPSPGLPQAVAAALRVIEGSDVPLRAREVCEALGEPDAGVQAMRNRLGRLAKSGLVVALEPGLYAMPGRAR